MEKLQKILKEKGIKYYIVPTDDDHQSEYVGEFYKARAYLSGFTGSAGTLLVGQDEAYLWTDGRYFLQASEQLPDSIQLMKMGTPGVPALTQFLIDHLSHNDVLGFDGKVNKAGFILDLIDSLTFDLKYESIDLIPEVFEGRPQRSAEKAYLYDNKYQGQPTCSKLDWIRDYMEVNDCDHHVISSLDDIAWIFNIRGNDVACTPTVLAFAIINKTDAYLYLQAGAYDDVLKNTLEKDAIHIKDYEEIYADVRSLKGTTHVDFDRINFELFSCLTDEIMNGENPSQYFKSIKNEVEIQNTKNAHLKDGVAMTQFMFWLKNNVCGCEHTELSISDKLESFRKAQDLYVEPSFDTICGYNEHGAIVHYKANEKSNVKVEPKGFLLIDSGAQYLDGTTDITRTFVLGELDSEQKHNYTLVLKAHLRLMNAKFPLGTTGINLDMICREVFYQEGLDFKHGTGHGVGHFLGVHEGPNEFRMKSSKENGPVPIEAGMVTTDEPGLYFAGKYGIRIENELLCVKDFENEYGEFLKFEPLTLVPYDLDGVDVSMLTFEEKEWLNQYHSDVYNAISPFLNDEEKDWLSVVTREV